MKKDKLTLDEYADSLLKDENPTAEAVNALIKVKDRLSGEHSEVELKTDLTEDEIKIHTVLDVMSNTLEMDARQFSEKCILSSVIERKERKSLSKNRQSRSEIVAVARQPDINMGMGQMPERQGFLKRFFTSRKQEVNK